MPYSLFSNFDVNAIHFTPVQNDGRQKVEMFKDDSSTHSRNKIQFNLCPNPKEPFRCKYRLDSVHDNQDGSRRGLVQIIEDETERKALEALDERVRQMAMVNSKEWFKKATIEEATISDRYKPLVFKPNADEAVHCLKYKVKFGGQVPTRMHLLLPGGKVRIDQGTMEHLSMSGAHVAPILSIYGIWFAGGGQQFGVTIQAEELIVRPGTLASPLSNFCGIPGDSIEFDEEGDEHESKRVKVEENSQYVQLVSSFGEGA